MWTGVDGMTLRSSLLGDNATHKSNDGILIPLLRYSVHHNNKLDWSDNKQALYETGQSRLLLLWKLGTFGILKTLSGSFHEFVVASAIFYNVFCCGKSITTVDMKNLNEMIWKDCTLDSGKSLWGEKIDDQVFIINGKPCLSTLAALSNCFSEKFIHPQCSKEKYHSSFLPSVIRPSNQHGPKAESHHHTYS